MPLWERYQQYLVTTDPTELVLIIDQFERVMPAGAALPSWMRVWGHHVTNHHSVWRSIPKRSELPAPSGLLR
jgi:hypothetical protein